MQHAIKFSVLFISVFVLLIGHGLQLALLPVRASELGWSAGEVGITGSIYFLGFLVGCILVPKFVSRVGHLRVFSATTTVCGAALLLIATSDSVYVWSALRFLTGIAISGCYIVIESWLNDQSSDENRGRVLATYSMIVLAGMALGQYSLSFGTPLGPELIIIGSVLLSTSIIPVTLTPVEQPAMPAKTEFDLRSVANAAPTALGCAFLIGAVTGALFTLVPLVTRELAFDLSSTALVLVAMLVGGAAMQYPAGKLSDRVDRRKVIVALLLLGVIVCLTLAFLPVQLALVLFGFFLLGGAANAIYPICLAHANDRMPGQFVVAGTVILFVNSAGAVSGPMGLAPVIDQFGASGFFLILATVMVLAIGWAMLGLIKRDAATVEEPFVSLAKSSPVLLELDPRSHSETPGEAEARL